MYAARWWKNQTAQPGERSSHVYRSREQAAKRERDGTAKMCQINNGETDSAGKFHKTLPHDDLGQVLYARLTSVYVFLCYYY